MESSRERGTIWRAPAAIALLCAMAMWAAASPRQAEAANGLEPILDCVTYDSGQNLLTAHWGYSNVNGVPITPAPSDNYFDPPPFFRGQPTQFEPGVFHNVFQTTTAADTPLTWNLFGSAVTATNDPDDYCDEEIDATPPDTAILDGPRGVVPARSATFELFSEGGATFECSLDAAAFSSCSSPLTISGLADGEHTLRVRATDGSQNVDLTPAERTWTVDGTAPDAPVIGSPSDGTWDRDGSLNISGTAEPGSTVRLYEGGVRLGTSEADPVTGAWTIGLVDLAEGGHELRARATDPLGNESPPAAGTSVRVDRTPPVVLRVIPRGNRVARGADVMATFSEPVSGGANWSGAIRLRRRGVREPLAATVAYEPASRTATLDPVRKLRTGITYRIVISTAIRDEAGNRLPDDVVRRFTVG